MTAQEKLSSDSATSQPVHTVDVLVSSSALEKGQCEVWLGSFQKHWIPVTLSGMRERPAFPQCLYQGSEEGTYRDVIRGPRHHSF